MKPAMYSSLGKDVNMLMNSRSLKYVIFFVLIILLLNGCGQEIITTVPEKVYEEKQIEKEIEVYDKANEAGQVMIMMYHVIGGSQEKDWAQTSENFRRDLERYCNEGYSLISLVDFVENNITVPKGRTPLIFTFDDSTLGHYRYIIDENGSKIIDPDCAVGILLDFGQKHPEFGHTATFYINDLPFGQSKYWQEKLITLVKEGFDIGNHTLTHPKLKNISDVSVQKELSQLAKTVESVVSGYKVKSLALPFGIWPKNKELSYSGVYEGYEYKHIAVLKVGAQPAKAPNTRDFNSLSLPRIKASTDIIERWLQYFEDHPEERYISDGNPQTITIPKDKENLIDKNLLGDKELIIISK